MKKSKIIILGVSVAVTIFLLAYGINYLKGRNLFKKERSFFAVFKNIDNLTESSPVLLNGTKIGRIGDISFKNTEGTEIVVEFIIDKDIDIPKKSHTKIFSSDIMGSRGVRLIFSDNKNFAEDGDYFIGGIESGLQSKIDPMLSKSEKLLAELTKLTTNINKILNDATIKRLNNTIKNIENTSSQIDGLIAAEKKKLSRIISNVEEITKNEKKISYIIDNFKDISDTIKKAEIATTLLQTQETLKNFNSIVEKINKGEGSVGQLINNKKLYENLESTSKRLDILMKDFNENPKKYVSFPLFDFSKSYTIDENGKKTKMKKN